MLTANVIRKSGRLLLSGTTIDRAMPKHQAGYALIAITRGGCFPEEIRKIMNHADYTKLWLDVVNDTVTSAEVFELPEILLI